MSKVQRSLPTDVSGPKAFEWRPLSLLALLWAPVVAALVWVWALSDVDPVILMRDPAATTSLPKYLGLFTSLSVLGWTVAAGIFLGTAYVIRGQASTVRRVRFCVGAGGFLTLLMLDDLLLLHESASRRGVPQIVVFGLYAVVAVAWLIAFRDVVAETPLTLLLAAGLMFALSLGVDVLFETEEARWRIIAEDGAKFLGIVAIAAYAAGTAQRFIRGLSEPERQAPLVAER